MRRLIPVGILWLGIVVTMSAHAGPSDFLAPQPVTIRGYTDHAMEPFLSRDGQWLFFNNRNRPSDQTDLHVSKRIDDLQFKYLGPLTTANSEKLDGVPTLSQDGSFYFVSTRAYDTTVNTLWQGTFADGAVTDVRAVRGNTQRRIPRWFNMDVEISADGETLYVTDNLWRLFGGGPQSSNFLAARRQPDGSFRRLENADEIFANINTDLLEFAAAVSSDELTLYFTRVDRSALARGAADGFGLYVATRSEKNAPFGPPERIEAIRGYVEAATVSPDDCAIYFHKQVAGRFDIQLARKKDCSRD